MSQHCTELYEFFRVANPTKRIPPKERECLGESKIAKASALPLPAPYYEYRE